MNWVGMKKDLLISFISIGFIVSLILFAGFAGHNDLIGTVNSKGHIEGFWFGIAHGFLFIISMVVSLFNNKINIYEVHNTGLGYNIGFIIGVIIWFAWSVIFKIIKLVIP